MLTNLAQADAMQFLYVRLASPRRSTDTAFLETENTGISKIQRYLILVAGHTIKQARQFVLYSNYVVRRLKCQHSGSSLASC